LNKKQVTVTTITGGLMAATLLIGGISVAQEGGVPGDGFAAVPGQVGGQDVYGPYEIVENWPKPLAESLPGHEGWTYSVTMDVFAESPDRVFLVQNGELPLFEERPDSVWLPELGRGLQYPNFRLPLRQAGGSIPNGDKLEDEGVGRPGIDWRYEHCVLVVDAEGNIVEGSPLVPSA
jgi:hypothetical protein